MANESDLRRNLKTFLARLSEYFPPNEKTVLYMGGGAAILLVYEGQIRMDDVDLIGEKTGLLKRLSERSWMLTSVSSKPSSSRLIRPTSIDRFVQGWSS